MKASMNLAIVGSHVEPLTSAHGLAQIGHTLRNAALLRRLLYSCGETSKSAPQFLQLRRKDNTSFSSINRLISVVMLAPQVLGT